MRFNPPPGWPVPRGWSPPPDWEPDPRWPSAPSGWAFWLDDAQAFEGGSVGTSARKLSFETPGVQRTWRIPVPGLAALAVLPVLALAVLLVFATNHWIMKEPSHAEPVTPRTNRTFAQTPVSPDWPAPGADLVDLSSWSRFGGIDARFGDNGRSVSLDTHDTTQTWRTKWSGLIQQGPPLCTLHISGRVRDVAHIAGVPGGFSVGLATLTSDGHDDKLTGAAIQFDYGQQGYRFATYPSDSDQGLVAAPLDSRWHDIEVIFDNGSQALLVDGRQAASEPVVAQCGHPMIRVWAGAAEFADFKFL